MKRIEKTCLHRFLGDCPECKKDLKINHSLNNYDCPRYTEIKLRYYQVVKDKE
jgi:hypothetical protein